MYSEQH